MTDDASAARDQPGDRPFGPDAAAILATEHWSLLANRSLIWNEAMSRATVFLSVLSASTIALALVADATGFGPQTTTLALVLLPVVRLLGIAAHGRLVEINREEVELSLAMNRLRHADLQIAPAWSPTSPPATTTTSRAWRPAIWPGGASAAVGAVPGQHADDRGDGGRRPRGRDCRARGPGGRGGRDRRCGGGGGGVPGRLVGAVPAAGPLPGPAAPYDAAVPHPARPSLNDLPVRLPRSSQWSAAVHRGLRRSRQPPQANTQDPLGRGCREDDRLGSLGIRAALSREQR
jgi:hypothetical protein